MVADRVHIARGGQEIGQFTVQEIPGLIASSQLMETDFFWRPGMTAWKPLYDLVNTQKVWKLPFPRPEEKSANLWDQLLSRESKPMMLAMLWDKLTAAQQECQLTAADIEQINQATRSNLHRRCKKELEAWYPLMVPAHLVDDLLHSQGTANLNNPMYSLGMIKKGAS